MRDYLQTLIWAMFFIVIVEMTFPVSDIKKYLKFVLGFIVLYVIVAPLVNQVIASRYLPGDSLENYIQYYQQYLGEEVEYSSLEEEKTKQKQGLMDIYRTQMEKQAGELLQTQMPEIQIEDIKVNASLREEGVKIESVDVQVEVKESETIGLSLGNKNESTVLSEDQLEKQIKKHLNNFYNWDNTNIHITVRKN